MPAVQSVNYVLHYYAESVWRNGTASDSGTRGPGLESHLGHLVMPRLGRAYCFRRVRSQRKSVDRGTMGPALGGAYECYAHISRFFSVHSLLVCSIFECDRVRIRMSVTNFSF